MPDDRITVDSGGDLWIWIYSASSTPWILEITLKTSSTNSGHRRLPSLCGAADRRR